MLNTLTSWTAEVNAELEALKKQARYLVNVAVKDGTLFKPVECSHCGSKKKIEGHHPDYCQPLVVEWLCQKCHRAYHAKMNREAAYRLGIPDAAMTKKASRGKGAPNE